MEIIDPEEKRAFEQKKWANQFPAPNPMGRIMGGMIIIIVGIVLLARKMGVYFPEWLFTWPMLVLTIGFYVGAKHAFRPGGWMIAMIVGAVFLTTRWMPDWNLEYYFWPIILIAVGVVMMLTPCRNRRFRNRMRFGDYSESLSDDTIDSVSVFGGVKKNVISKNFKGGVITCVFGGAEINLSQADINDRTVLEVNQVFGGTKLIIPPNWQVLTEVVAILGGIEDNRPIMKEGVDSKKILVLRGHTVFGGISLKSY